MEIIISFLLLIVSTSAFAVEGYQDIYLDREQPTYIHSIFCGKDLKNLRALKPSYIYTNSNLIEEGTYYYSKAYGKFSYTFKPITDQDPSKLLARGLLSGGKIKKEKMIKEVCIVGKMAGLPNALAKHIHSKTILVDSPEWDATMTKYALFGKPAFGKGVFTDQRTTAKYDAHDQQVYDANQAYVKAIEAQFQEKFKRISAKLPDALKGAVQYAKQENGFLKTKTCQAVKEPAVWTVTAKNRYDEQSRRKFRHLFLNHLKPLKRKLCENAATLLLMITSREPSLLYPKPIV